VKTSRSPLTESNRRPSPYHLSTPPRCSHLGKPRPRSIAVGQLIWSSTDHRAIRTAKNRQPPDARPPAKFPTAAGCREGRHHQPPARHPVPIADLLLVGPARGMPTRSPSTGSTSRWPATAVPAASHGARAASGNGGDRRQVRYRRLPGLPGKGVCTRSGRQLSLRPRARFTRRSRAPVPGKPASALVVTWVLWWQVLGSNQRRRRRRFYRR
jgi:hypothetical protein